MRGVICESRSKLVYLDHLPEPVLQPNSAIVQIRRVGICGTDYHAFGGKQPFFSYPRILGHELAGEIIDISSNDQGFCIGDKVSIIPYFHCGICQACLASKTNCCEQMKVFGVHIDGGLRERVAVPIDNLIKVNTLSYDEAVLIEPLAIGAHALTRSGLQPQQKALVIGAGPIGLGIIALINSIGAQAIVLDVNETRLQFAKSWGRAEHIIYAKDNIDIRAQIADLTSNQFPSIVFDATGNEQSMIKAFDYTSHGGSLVYVGLVQAQITFDDPHFHRKELTLMSSRNATRHDFELVLKAIDDGYIQANRFITHRCKLEQFTENFELWLEPSANVIKAVVEL